jgi:hypothetical protein
VIDGSLLIARPNGRRCRKRTISFTTRQSTTTRRTVHRDFPAACGPDMSSEECAATPHRCRLAGASRRIPHRTTARTPRPSGRYQDHPSLAHHRPTPPYMDEVHACGRGFDQCCDRGDVDQLDPVCCRPPPGDVPSRRTASPRSWRLTADRNSAGLRSRPDPLGPQERAYCVVLCGLTASSPA